MRPKPRPGWEGLGVEVLHASDFLGTQLKREGTYVVCFGATWCPPTRSFMPKFVARAGRLPATLAIADISDWDDPLWDTFRIKITPTMIAFRDGSPLGRFDGRRMLRLGESHLDRLTALLEGLATSRQLEGPTDTSQAPPADRAAGPGSLDGPTRR
jgi:thioredoxin-like negative regulator of GroEL